VADNGLQALIQTPTPNQTPAQPAPERAADEGTFDLIRLGATTKLDPRWLQQADPLLMLPSDSAALADLQAAGLVVYRLIPALNALVALATDEEPAILFVCGDTRAAWLGEQGRLIRST
ncbi:MAG: hypothetical protein VBE63_30690, partial [Lamprobacter sp.]|uniref:hypothetical protein n=1 Tax=Lamprobacter sp. TaxID=3100796 RepID=UPI002B260B10